MVRVILISMGILTAIYLLVNVALLYGLGLGGLSNTRTDAADIVGISFGSWAQQALALFIAIAALTSINATMVVGARSSFAMARDWLTLGQLGQWKSESGSPTRAYLLQALISLGLIVLGTQEADGFTAMVEFTAPVFWGFLCLVGLSLFLLRQRDPHRVRPFKVPLYPITPALFSIACAYLTWSSLGYAISQNAVHISLFLLLSGLIALFILQMKENTNHKKNDKAFLKK
jgi:amino acid transporter